MIQYDNIVGNNHSNKSWELQGGKLIYTGITLVTVLQTMVIKRKSEERKIRTVFTIWTDCKVGMVTGEIGNKKRPLQ